MKHFNDPSKYDKSYASPLESITCNFFSVLYNQMDNFGSVVQLFRKKYNFVRNIHETLTTLTNSIRCVVKKNNAMFWPTISIHPSEYMAGWMNDNESTTIIYIVQNFGVLLHACRDGLPTPQCSSSHNKETQKQHALECLGVFLRTQVTGLVLYY